MEQALGDQGEAMSKLREGAKGMAEQLMQQSRGQQDSPGADGEARGDNRDPLGRPDQQLQRRGAPDARVGRPPGRRPHQLGQAQA